jgi:WD40 repeat protein
MAYRVPFLLTCWLLLGTAFAAEPASGRKDFHGDILPEGALARFGTTRFRPGPHAKVLAYSPDGKLLASHGGDRGLTLWDPATGREVLAISATAKDSSFHGIAFSPDSNTIATIEKDRVHIWDIETGKRKRTLAAQERILSAIRFTADGKKLLVLTSEGLVSRDLCNDGPPSLEFDSTSGQPIAFSHDTELLATTADNRLKLWSRAKKVLLHECEATSRDDTEIAFAPTGETLAYLATGSIILFDLAARKHIDAIKLEGASHLAWSPDGKTLVVSVGRELCRVDVPRRKCTCRWRAHETPIVALAWSPDGKQLVSAAMNDGTLGVWDASSGKDLLPARGHRWGIGSVALTPDGKQLFTHSWDGTMICWDRTTGGILRQSKGANEEDAGVMEVSPDGQRIVVANKNSSAAVLCDAATGKLVRRLSDLGGGLAGIKFSRDGKLLAVAGNKGELHVSEADSGRELWREECDVNYWGEIGFTPADRSLVTLSSSDDSQVRVWGVRDGKELFRMGTGLEGARMAVFPDGTRAAIAGRHDKEDEILILDLSTRLEAKRWSIPAECYRSMVVSPDGCIIATGAKDDSLIRLWEVSSGQLIRQFSGHYCGVSTLQFAERGRTLISGSWDTSILIWDVTGRKAQAVEALTAQRLALLWETLAEADAARAYAALWELSSSPSLAVPFLRKRLRSALQIDPQLLTTLLVDLDHRSFRVREQAGNRLLDLGMGVEAALRKLLAANPTLEHRRRAESVLQRLLKSTARQQTIRAMQALEHADTEIAWKALDELALFDAHSSLSQHARAALTRRPMK